MGSKVRYRDACRRDGAGRKRECLEVNSGNTIHKN
jgi:hypothetical protein